MKKFFIFFTGLAALSLAAAQVNLFERFDQMPVKGTLMGGGKIAPASGVEKGALAAKGNGNNYQYIYQYKFPVKPGEKYTVTFNAKAPAPGLFVFVFFQAEKGKPAIPPRVIKVGSTANNWTFRIFDFTVPAGAVSGDLRLRLVKCPSSQEFFIDHLRLAPKGKLDMTDFETAFDGWVFNKHLIFDRFMMRNTGTIVNEWKEAKVGEAFFKAVGNGERMQYPLYIENLDVIPGCNYQFTAFLKASTSFRFPNNGMIIFFYKDAKGRPVGQSRYHIRATNGEWKEFTHAFTVSPKAVKLDIGLNMRKMPQAEFVQLDHIRFRKSASNVECSAKIDPDKNQLTLNNMVSADIPQASIKKMEYIFSDGRKIPAKFQEPQILSIAGMKDGSYAVFLNLELSDGKVKKTPLQKFMICRNPAWRNDLGILKDNEVPPAPWKTLQRSGNNLATWNNDFIFSRNFDLVNIKDTSVNVPLLASPLKITVNGKKLSAANLRWQDGKSRTLLSGKCSGQNWKGNLTCKVDFTGFAHFTLDIAADSNFKLEQCDVDFELEDMKFLYRSDDSWTAIGAVDLKKSPVWETKNFYNELQFGNEDRGISFFIDRLYPAKGKFDRSWIKVNGKKIKVHTVVSPLVLEKGKTHKIQFALQPYPYRPAENNWRKLRFRAGKYKNLDLLWHTNGHYSYCGSTSHAAKPDVIRNIIKNKKGNMLYYQFPFYIMDNIPEWSYFEKRWKGMPARAYDLRKRGGMAWKARLTDKDWQDFYLHHFVDHLKNFAWDGVYYDCFGSDVFTENGQTFHPVFACKNFQERIYIAQRLNNPNSLTVTHTGGSQSGTAASYANVILMGEQYRGQCSRYTYPLEFLTLDEFRYENAVNMGPDRMFLPQYHDQAKISNPKLASHLMGLVLSHNLMLYPNFINKKVELAVRYRQFDFGMENSTFYPYWKKHNIDLPVCSNKKVVASYWKNDKGIFMVILNPTSQEQSFQIKVPANLKMMYYYSPEQAKEIKSSVYTLPGYMSSSVRFFSR